MDSKRQGISRRAFVRAAAAASAGPMILGAAPKGSGKTFKVGLLGCGGRGSGALRQSLEAARLHNFRVEVVGVADYFKERAEKIGSQYSLPSVDCFSGPDAYLKLLETDVEIVLMAVAPLFRPLHLEAAVKAGKHVFLEKPVAVDPPGCRRVIAAGELAKQKGLALISGVDNRHNWRTINTHQAVAVEGALGQLYGGRIAYLTGHFFSRTPIRPKEPADLIRTWQNWIALSGDHLVEQHVHNIDTANWFVGRPPISAVGVGGRARRPAGDMYDFFSVDFDYGAGVHIHSVCRQVKGCFNWIGHDFVYEKGRTNGSDGPAPKQSPILSDLPEAPNPQVQEQTDVLYHVAKGHVLDNAREVAEATAAAIMGRISAYTGAQVTWEEIMGNPNKNPALYNLTLKPTAEDFEKGTVEIPKEGVIPIPGEAA